MLKKSLRLPRELFKDLGTAPGFFHSSHFMMKAVSSPLGPRVGVSVSKKVSKKANIRNTIRRRAYSVIGELMPLMSKKLYLIVAKPKAELVKGKVLETELAELIKKG